jgi:hypothetical protein
MLTFGGDTIRRFSDNMLEMKKLAACDFEDLIQVRVHHQWHKYWQQADNMIQCAIPAFDDLLPEPHNNTILRLLFTCGHWHGLAKLCMHTDNSLKILDELTHDIGTEFRTFMTKTCPAFNTKEQCNRETSGSAKASSGPKPAKFSIQTYKFHSLGDYVTTIREFGMCDSYSTEPISSPNVHYFSCWYELL